MKLQSIYVLLAAALLALGACAGSGDEPVVKTVVKTVVDPEAEERADAAKEAQDAAEKAQDAAEKALEDLRGSLARAQNALGTGSNAEQREKARETVVTARKDLKTVTTNLGRQPASGARTAAQAALTAVDKALELTVAALAATDDALAPGAGPASLTSMHTALDQAQKALDEAQTKLTAALAAKPSTEIKTLLAQAQATLSTAQVSLVPELRRELAALDPLVRLGDPLTPVEMGKSVAPGAPNAKAGGGVNADFTYMARSTHTAKELPTGSALTDAATYEYKDPLEIQNEGVLWTTGKKAIGGAGGDELMLRGTVLRDSLRTGTAAKPVAGNSDRGLPILGYGTPVGNDWYNWRFPMRSSIRLPSDPTKGPTIEMGGPGIIFYDMEQRLRAQGGYCPAGQTETLCDDATSDDVRVAFTSQAVRDPTGAAAYYWRTDIPFDPEDRNSKLFSEYTTATEITFGADGNCAVTAATAAGGCVGTPTRAGVLDAKTAEDKDGEASFEVFDTGSLVSKTLYATERLTCRHNWCKAADPRDFGRPLDQGQYRVWLSNYAGKDSYLEYAAYGLAEFLDSAVHWTGPVRSQAFHFGYDAYGAGDNAVPPAGDPLEAKFNGRTTGWLLRTAYLPPGSAPFPDQTITSAYRLRGSVELTARIGGGANTIAGEMNDFEVFDNGIWSNRFGSWYVLPRGDDGDPGVHLTNGVIAADGTYKGRAEADGGQFAVGAFEGAFYGPTELGKLETAGSWYLPPTTQAGGRELGIVLGSFGARSDPAP